MIGEADRCVESKDPDTSQNHRAVAGSSPDAAYASSSSCECLARPISAITFVGSFDSAQDDKE